MATRRGHRKSRYGCSECKRRHIKCDETHPICSNCTISARQCSFLDSAPRVPKPTSIESTSSPSDAGSTPSSSDIPPANLDQLELLHHFSQDSLEWPFNYASSEDFGAAAIIQEALSCDFLMNEALAFSSRHLAVVRPERREFYLRQAKQLQTYALEAFTRQRVQPNNRNCLSVLFFSWLIGTHLLCDVTTINNDEEILEEFLHYMRLYRGVRLLPGESWKCLRGSKHKGIFAHGEATANRVGTGDHTSSLQLLVQESLGLDSKEKRACLEALSRLQWVFDLYEDEGPEKAAPECFMMSFTWPLVISLDVAQLCKRKRPEALLILAHFSILLHWCREYWIFSDVGSRLLRSISIELGQGWERWLEYPSKMVEDVGDTAEGVQLSG